jgi:hypothetical protein
MILWLSSFPGSGCELLESLLRDYFNAEILKTPVPSLNSPAPDGEGLAVFSTHEKQFEGQKIIYLVRDPRDTVAALSHSSRSVFGADLTFVDIICGRSPHGDWLDHVKSFHARSNDKALVVKYEDAVRDPQRLLRQISDFLNIEPGCWVSEQSHSRNRFADFEENKQFQLSSSEKIVVSFLYEEEMRRFGYEIAPDVDLRVVASELRKVCLKSGDLQKALQSEIAYVKRGALENHALLDKLARLENALEPRLKSILKLRPLRYALAQRNRLKRDNAGSASPLAPAPGARQAHIHAGQFTSAETIVSEVRDQAKFYSAESTQYIAENFGVAVFAHDRARNVSNVLRALELQGAASYSHVWIDGDHGNPEKRARVDLVEDCVKQFDVKRIHRNRGNFGFRKMMLLAMRYMMERYEKILFLEDDCFPTRRAIEVFCENLTQIADDKNVFSVYGHYFGFPEEENGSARFQGWGWATTAEKLRPVWAQLMDCYLKTEEEYLEFVDEQLTPEVEKLIDITPGRQPSETIRKFFAWDETLCLITAIHGMKHQQTSERVIYNFGACSASAHFHQVEHFRQPPFNMISIDEVWDKF